MGDTTNPIGYEDGGLIRGSFKINIDGAVFLLKEGKIANPARTEREYGVQGAPDSASYVGDFSTMQVTIMNRKGGVDPVTKRFRPFAFKGDVWIISASDASFSTQGLQAFTAEINRLYNDPVEPVYPE